jgi:hypothetical protein
MEKIIQKEHKQPPKAISWNALWQLVMNNTVEGKRIYKATRDQNDEVVITKLII